MKLIFFFKKKKREKKNILRPYHFPPGPIKNEESYWQMRQAKKPHRTWKADIGKKKKKRFARAS
jgi:hypothetical protein